MKLFGNKRNAAHLGRRGGGSEKGARRLTGTQKGLILMAASVLLLGVTVIAVYKDFVKPPELPKPQEVPSATVPAEGAEQTFRPPTVIEIETQVNEETGEEIQVETEVPASHKEGFYNILIVGTDDDGLRTDTIMIARMDVNDHSVAIMSIPRDTLIESAMPVPKINGAYSYVGMGERGINNLKSHLATLLGFEVDGYALINLDAFVELVDLVGGVEFNVPMKMQYSDPSQDLYIDLEAGLQTLDGEHAMQLVRYRKGYATQDLQRTQVQQQFLKALAKQCLKVVNLPKIGEMAEIFMENVTTDLTVGNIAYFGQELLQCDFDEMYTYTLEGEGVTMNGLSYYAVYLENTLQAVNAYFNPYETEINADHVVILTPAYIRSLQPAKEDPEEPPTEDPLIGDPLTEDPPMVEDPEPEFDGEADPEQLPVLPTDEWLEVSGTEEDPSENPNG